MSSLRHAGCIPFHSHRLIQTQRTLQHTDEPGAHPSSALTTTGDLLLLCCILANLLAQAGLYPSWHPRSTMHSYSLALASAARPTLHVRDRKQTTWASHLSRH